MAQKNKINDENIDSPDAIPMDNIMNQNPESKAPRPDLPEEIAMVDEHTGEVIGSVDRHTAHTNGIWHASTHVWILDASGNLLVQQRAAWTRRFPKHWDISAAGHMKVGEEGNLREVSEELGVTPVLSEVEFLGILRSTHTSEGFLNRERPRVYLWRSKLELSEFFFPDDEAMGLASLPLSDVSRFIRGAEVPCNVLRNGRIDHEYIFGKNLVPQSDAYWNKLHEAVKWTLPVKLEHNNHGQLFL